MRRVFFWPLFLLVAPQAIWLRRTARATAEAGGPREGRTGEGPPFRLCGVGDSIIAGCGAPTIDDALVGRAARSIAAARGVEVHWSAVGRSGFTAQRTLQELVPLLPREPQDAFVVSLGVNDVTRLRRTRAWEESLAAVLDALHAHSPHAAAAVCGLPPLNRFPLLPQPLRFVLGVRARTFDAVVRDVVRARPWSCHVAMPVAPAASDFAEDGFHPKVATFAALGESVARVLLAR